MRTTHLSLLFFFLNIFFLSGQNNGFYIQAGTMYDSESNSLVQDRVIHVKGKKILSVEEGDNIPENANVIDLRDYTVLPGLIDAHTHVLFNQELKDDFSKHSIATLVLESEALRALRGVERARSYLDVGITSIKDLGNSGPFLDVALRDAINEGSVQGPRIFAVGKIISSAGGQIYGVNEEYQGIIEQEYRVIKDKDDAINAVREHVNQGVDLIKICADNLPNNTRLTIQEMQSIVETAHDYGLTVTAHSVNNKSAWEAIKAGVDGIEHGFFIADTTLSLMAKEKVYLVPTENSRNYMESYYLPEGSVPGEPTWIDSYITRMQDRLQNAIEKGVTIVAGSDNYTNIHVPRGVSSRDMFRAYFDSGMKPLDILQSSTYLSAKSLKKEKEIGVIQAGAFADIIAIKGDLENDFIKAIEEVVFVMKDGQVYLKEAEGSTSRISDME